MPSVAPPRQDLARFILVLILIFFLCTSPDSSPGVTTSQNEKFDRILRSKASLSVLNSSRWLDFSPYGSRAEADNTTNYLNLTGFRKHDAYWGWRRLSAWKERCAKFSREAYDVKEKVEKPSKALYTNITGIVQGKWTRSEYDLASLDRPLFPGINLTNVAPSINWAFEEDVLWARNITGRSGRIRIRFEEKEGSEVEDGLTKTDQFSAGPIRETAATILLQDESNSGDGWEIRAHGVHWPLSGTLVLTTTSEKFAGIFGLPHLTHDPIQYASSQSFLNQVLGKTIGDSEKVSQAGYSSQWFAGVDTRSETTLQVPHCEFVIFVQVHPFTLGNTYSSFHKNPTVIASDIENELRTPSGAPIPMIPKLKVSTVILSPDCGFMLESKGPPVFALESGDHLVGEKQEVILRHIKSWLNLFALVIFGQILLLQAQSKETSTPSTVGRVSLYSISTMLFADASLFASLSLLSGTSPNLFPSALLVSFMSLMAVMLGIRLLNAIWNSQEPERRNRTRQIQTAAAAAATTPSSSQIIASHQHNTGSREATTPNIPTQPPQAELIIIPSDQDIDAEIFEDSLNTGSSLPTTNPNVSVTPVQQTQGISFATMYIRSILLLTVILLVTLTSNSWPIWLRKIYIQILSLIYLSFPSFQICRNIQRNCRKALLWKFVIGQSICRLAPFAYFYMKDDKVFFAERDSKVFYILAGWLWLQCWVLAAQSVLGPRWGLPRSWYDEGWNYHPILREDNIEMAHLPIGLIKSRTPTSSVHLAAHFSSTEHNDVKGKDDNIRTVDCAICMQSMEVLVIAADDTTTSNGVSAMLERRRYMVTPCRHIFHSTCLEGWMRFRLQCPICRENLPHL
ncbi:unnamed protein product [Blumeria hordei]|uniref:DSC E3 ubiquitin ligase complex subunit A n=1 Tax=Blumeria hordei TaxID=2867405 RepID=A0A383URF8_BLUHO|nr:unnamed protein product [Blumeria hordei]